MDDMRTRRSHRDGRLIWGLHLAGRSARVSMGVMFIALGIVAFLAQQSIIPHEFWRHGWPWIIVIMSAVQIATAGSAGRLADGVFFGLIGGWLVLVESRWQGLTYANSWPLTLVAIGASYVVKAVAGTFLPDGPRRRLRDDVGSGEGDSHA